MGKVEIQALLNSMNYMAESAPIRSLKTYLTGFTFMRSDLGKNNSQR